MMEEPMPDRDRMELLVAVAVMITAALIVSFILGYTPAVMYEFTAVDVLSL